MGRRNETKTSKPLSPKVTKIESERLKSSTWGTRITLPWEQVPAVSSWDSLYSLGEEGDEGGEEEHPFEEVFTAVEGLLTEGEEEDQPGMSLEEDEGPFVPVQQSLEPRSLAAAVDRLRIERLEADMSPLDDRRSVSRDKAEAEEASSEGYGQEADAAWQLMYGGIHDSPVEPEYEAPLRGSQERSRASGVDHTGVRRRFSSAAAGHKTADRSRSDERHSEKVGAESGEQRSRSDERRHSHEGRPRGKTISFDGDLETPNPIMLRVGSVHVSLNTLEQATIARIKAKK